MSRSEDLAGAPERTDAELDRECETFIGRTSVATFIERAVNFHPYWHLTSIRATFEPAGQVT